MFTPFTDFIDLHGGMTMFSVLMIAPLAFMLMDIISGISRAWRDGEISSSVGRDGAGHKIAIIMSIVAMFFIEFVFYALFEIHFPVLIPAIVYILCNEGISIIENLCLLNPELCGVFAPILNILRNSRDEKIKELEEIDSIDDLIHKDKED